MKTNQHTPTPWAYTVKNIRGNNRTIASTCNDATGAGKGLNLEDKIVFDRENKANAEFIVRACNSWYNIEALENRLKELKNAR